MSTVQCVHLFNIEADSSIFRVSHKLNNEINVNAHIWQKHHKFVPWYCSLVKFILPPTTKQRILSDKCEQHFMQMYKTFHALIS